MYFCVKAAVTSVKGRGSCYTDTYCILLMYTVCVNCLEKRNFIICILTEEIERC
jgi:hypothetical protein